MAEFAPEAVHEALLAAAPRVLPFDPGAYFPEWQSAARRTYKQLLGLMPAKGPLDVQIEYEKEEADFTEVRFVFTSEPHAQVPCHLLLPRERKAGGAGGGRGSAEALGTWAAARA